MLELKPTSWPRGQILTVSLVLLSMATAAGAQTVTVTPRRIVFEGATRSAEVTLLNRSKSPSTYRVSFVQARMDEDGKLDVIEEVDSSNRPADGMIRYAPRVIPLEPNVPQTIRLSLRKPRDLGDGEYRSHLVFRSIPKDAGFDIEEAAAVRAAGAVAPQLTMIPALVIPVIVRHGEVSVRLSVDDLEFLPPAGAHDPPLVSLSLKREGNRSIYTYASFEFISDLQKAATPVGVIRGISVYFPNTEVQLRLPLHPPPDLDLSSGTLRVTLTAQPELDGGRLAEGTVLAQAKVRIP